MTNKSLIILLISLILVFPNYKTELNINNFKIKVYTDKEDTILINKMKKELRANKISKEINSTKEIKNNKENYTYNNGIYQATVNSFKPKLKIQVEVKNDKIIDIKVLSHRDTQIKMNYAKTRIIKNILEKNSYEVDTITTATYSSEGIKRGVKACLDKAKK